MGFFGWISDAVTEAFAYRKEMSGPSTPPPAEPEPALSGTELECIKLRINQIADTYKILNATLNPDVFFGRLGFLFDTLLSLQPYERAVTFTGSTPSQQIKAVEAGLEGCVKDFISRYMTSARKQSDRMKTQKGKAGKYEEFIIKLIAAFDCADSFWEGNTGFPHYTKPLFTQSNYEQVQAIYDEMCDKDFEDMKSAAP